MSAPIRTAWVQRGGEIIMLVARPLPGGARAIVELWPAAPAALTPWQARTYHRLRDEAVRELLAEAST